MLRPSVRVFRACDLFCQESGEQGLNVRGKVPREFQDHLAPKTNPGKFDAAEQANHARCQAITKFRVPRVWGKVDRQKESWNDRWLDGWLDGWMGGWEDEQS